MKTTALSLFILLTLPLLAAAMVGSLAAAEETDTWELDYAKARDAARKARKPIFLVFR